MKNRHPTDRQIAAAIRRGFGQGEGDEYLPWVYVRDVASHGRSWMTKSLRTGRTHHYTTDAQRQIHLLLDYQADITSIRDQFALLPREETVAIAERLELKHPIYPKTGVVKVLYTPILARRRTPMGTQETAVEVTPSSITRSLAAELVIKRVYWERRGVTWMTMSPKDIPQPKAKNRCFFHALVSASPPQASQPSATSLKASVTAHWHPQLTLNDLAHAVASEFAVGFSVALSLIGQAVLQRQIELDDSHLVSHFAPFPLKAD